MLRFTKTHKLYDSCLRVPLRLYQFLRRLEQSSDSTGMSLQPPGPYTKLPEPLQLKLFGEQWCWQAKAHAPWHNIVKPLVIVRADAEHTH